MVWAQILFPFTEFDTVSKQQTSLVANRVCFLFAFWILSLSLFFLDSLLVSLMTVENVVNHVPLHTENRVPFTNIHLILVMFFTCIVLIIRIVVCLVSFFLETIMLIGSALVRFHSMQRIKCLLWMEILISLHLILLFFLFGNDVILWWYLGCYIPWTKI